MGALYSKSAPKIHRLDSTPAIRVNSRSQDLMPGLPTDVEKAINTENKFVYASTKKLEENFKRWSEEAEELCLGSKQSLSLKLCTYKGCLLLASKRE